MHQKLTHLLAGLLILLFSLPSQADHLRAHLLLGATLTGSQEVPAVTTAARGAVSFTVNATRDTLFISGAFSGLSGPITMAHTHLGFRGVSGPVVTDLFRFIRGNRIQGFLTGTDIDRGKLDRYLRGGYYLNVHTAANPSGEIRGQIELEKDEHYIAVLSGANEVPPVTTSAVGIGTFSLAQAQDKMKFRVVATGLSGAITDAHFHQGLPGVAGGVIQSLLTYVSGNVIEGELTPDATVLAALASGQVYINIHTAANPGGEIRGQLVRQVRHLGHDARLDGAQMVPAVTTTAKAVAFGRLNATFDTLQVFLAHTGLSASPTSLTVFAKELGQANTAADLISTVSLTGAPAAFSVSFTGLSSAAVNLFLTGGVNFVLNTAANPNGEIRGQVYRLAREGYTFSMNGSQERPTPNASTAYGSGFVSMDRDQSNVHFSLAWGGLSGPVTGGHFHTGLRNQGGPVVFELSPFYTPAGNTAISAEGFWQPTGNAAPNAAAPFTARRALQFRRDSIYANIHTALYPAGEIRGQVFRGARDLAIVLSTQPAVLVAESFGYYPNPFHDAVTLSFDSRVAGTASVKVADLVGRTVVTRPLAVKAGANQPQLDLAGVAPGVYLVTIEIAGSRLVSRLVKE
ncbi:CHRD domain-containing protein [Hymenobacter sp. BT186]|uniref:CHRD domain-containing protein n=1 Tax=Hymenobacter telluris TaxID=2816474 RepID=A0A939ET35_9BACT|nr:CHRD domain-containing protein [Hymenobacter telluris]MBO0356629.1 CHRD domain-containing protein [Hymenobacter telluris]MBW3372654.1 CHRD domain-containing protein [Hymenobacter norwichensis]